MTNPVHLGVDEDGVELREGVPEELTRGVVGTGTGTRS